MKTNSAPLDSLKGLVLCKPYKVTGFNSNWCTIDTLGTAQHVFTEGQQIVSRSEKIRTGKQ